mgnify:CR=1 FL=1
MALLLPMLFESTLALIDDVDDFVSTGTSDFLLVALVDELLFSFSSTRFSSLVDEVLLRRGVGKKVREVIEEDEAVFCFVLSTAEEAVVDDFFVVPAATTPGEGDLRVTLLAPVGVGALEVCFFKSPLVF